MGTNGRISNTEIAKLIGKLIALIFVSLVFCFLIIKSMAWAWLFVPLMFIGVVALYRMENP